MFNLYPAIDLKKGNCVRLLHGDMQAATVYNTDPADQALLFKKAGFTWLHIVDLDGAFAGQSENTSAVEDILAASDVHIQLGGGVRTMESVTAWLEKGVTRVILGTAAVRDPAFVKEAARAYPNQIAVGIDARGGMVATQGWAQTTQHTSVDIARRFEDAGVAALIFTDISRDGALTGVNVTATAALGAAVSIPVIASGGVASITDIEVLATKRHMGIDGVIIGRALYDGSIAPHAAIDCVRHMGAAAPPSPCQ